MQMKADGAKQHSLFQTWNGAHVVPVLDTVHPTWLAAETMARHMFFSRHMFTVMRVPCTHRADVWVSSWHLKMQPPTCQCFLHGPGSSTTQRASTAVDMCAVAAFIPSYTGMQGMTGCPLIRMWFYIGCLLPLQGRCLIQRLR